MAQVWWIAGAINGFLAVGAGAFAAHGLKEKLTADMLATFETGARYQMYHAFALLAAGWLYTHTASSSANAAGWCFLGGIVFFSGSLYTLALTGVTKLGAITPVGGVLFLIGWVLLAIARFWAK